MIAFSRTSVLLYKVLRKFAICDYSVLYAADLLSIASTETDVDTTFETVFNLTELQDCNPSFNAEQFNSLAPNQFHCWGLKRDGHWVAYLWTGTSSIPADHNSNGHSWTGLPLELDDTTIYIFAAYVKTSERGKRLYQRLLHCIAQEYLKRGMERAVLTVDITNTPAIKTVRRVGFRAHATTHLVRLKNWGWARYSRKKIPYHCTFGSYQGDSF